MSVALISDMHGNAVALDAVLAELERESIDEIVCLGDVAQGGAQPAEVVDRLRALGCRCVYGNSDEFLLTLEPEESGEDADEAELDRLLRRAEWSREQLGPDRLEFLGGFDPVVELEVDEGRLVCCHATPSSNTEVVGPETPRERIAALVGDAAGVVGGHVHLQWLRRVGDSFWACCGSVGLAVDFTQPRGERPFGPRADYVVLGTSPTRVEFRRTSFDVGEVVRAIRASGMPDAERSASEWQSD